MNQKEINPDKLEKQTHIFCGDFRTYQIKENSIDLIITDPPYGQNYLHLWNDLGKVANKVLKPSGFLVTYAGDMFLPTIVYMLNKHLKWYAQFYLYHKGDVVVIRIRNLKMRIKPILIYQKPPVTPLPNLYENIVVSSKKEKGLHPWQQNLNSCKTLINIFSKPDDVVLDVMFGGGTTIEACRILGRKCIGIDKDQEAFNTTKKRILDYLKGEQ